ncbi:hypothetical protein HYC85_029510 [Camellia sinensis]|uniref:FAM50A/XAP5 C-terminal domain-containing protein n=1 Tax=Camellia sinensis TaxID=4442 RepID=A0A7J7FYD4_CAMSI|nr:hypothetical protein HYC85_029510 [Camellia sinensis]
MLLHPTTSVRLIEDLPEYSTSPGSRWSITRSSPDLKNIPSEFVIVRSIEEEELTNVVGQSSRRKEGRRTMSGMGDGYVGTAQDAVRIRRLEKQREAERRKIQELKNKTASTKGQPGLLQFGSGTSEMQTVFSSKPTRNKSVPQILETAFKKETVGLVTREQYVEKRVNIRTKIEEEEKEKLLKLQQEEEELQAQKRQKRKIRGNPRLSFSEDIENGSEEDVENSEANKEPKRLACGKLGKDPTVETSFLPDSTLSVRGRQRNKLSVKGCKNSGNVSRNRFETNLLKSLIVRKGDTIGEFLRAVQQQLAPEFREIRTTSVENLLYVKEDLIIPHQHSFYELIVNKARGKSGPLFHFDVHEDVRTIADATIEKDESHAGKVVERHWYEKNKHIFPASRWEIYDPTKKWERYTIHGD